MSTIDEREYYKNNPYFTGHIYGNFSPFYATIAVCTVIGVFVLLLNIICTCCSKYKHYWTDRHTGNRWLVSIWSATPHKQPPLDYTELEVVSKNRPITTQVFNEDIEAQVPIHQPSHSYSQPQRFHRPESRGTQRQQREEYVELQKRESDI
ncbi:hypothetical protein ACFFRR_010690 [Megaselia abdita]